MSIDSSSIVAQNWIGRLIVLTCCRIWRLPLASPYSLLEDMVFSPGAHLSPGQQKLLSLVGGLEGGCIRLHHLELRHPLISTTALRQQAYSHYMRAALPEVVKLVGSANLLGTPLHVPGAMVSTKAADAKQLSMHELLFSGKEDLGCPLTVKSVWSREQSPA